MKPRILNIARLSFPLAAALAAAISAPSVHAGNTWDGGGADNNWTTNANWNSDTAPTYTTALTFAGSARLSPNNNRTAASSIAGINFTNTATNAFTLGGNSATLGGAITTTAATSGSLTDTINMALILSATRTVTTNTNHHLTINGVVSGATFGLTKAGAATLTLGGANSYSGTTTIQGGTLRLANASAVGSSSGITMNTASNSLSLGVDTAMSLPALTGSSGSFTYTIVSDRATSGEGLTHSFSGANFGNATFATSAGSNVSSGTAGISFSGSPQLGGGSTGTATFSPGTANLTLPSLTATNASKTLALAGTGNGFITGVISPGSVGITAVNKSGTSTWTLSGLNTFAGNVTISGGTLVAGSSGNGTNSNLGLVNNTRTINVNTGGTLRFDASNVFNTTFSTPASSLPVLSIAGGTMTNGGSANNSALGDITLAGGTLTATTGSPIGTGQSGEGWGSWNLNGTVTSTGTSTISSTAPGGIPITLSATSGNGYVTTFDVQSGTLTASAVLGNVTRVGNETTSGLAKTGAGTMVLSGINTYTGNTSIQAGTLSIATEDSLPGYHVSGRFSVAAGATLALQNGVLDADVSAILATGNFASGANLGFDTAAGNRTISSDFADTANGPLGIVKLGANTLSLTGTNTHTGGTNIAAGSLAISSTSALPNWNVNGGFTLASGASLVIPNTVSEADVTTLLGTTNVAAGAILSFDTSLGNRNYVSAVTDSVSGLLNVAKIGNNTLTLAGANTYTGNTTVTAGGLVVSGSLDGSSSTSNFTFGTAAATTSVGILDGASLTLAALQGANNVSAVTAYRQSGGTVTVGVPNSTAEGAYGANSGYGYFEQTGGSLTVHSRYTAASNGGGGGKGVTRIGGGSGSATFTAGNLLAVSRGAGAVGELTVLPNANVSFTGTGTVNLLIHGDNTLGTGFLNIAGGTISSPAKPVSFGNGVNTNTSIGMINLGAGTLELSSNILTNTIATGTNRGYMNFSGGTLKLLANTSGNLLLPATSGGYSGLGNTVFGPVSNSTANLNGTGAASAVSALVGTTQNFSGGLTLDTGAFSTTISAPLSAPTGGGVSQANIVISDPGAGYVAPPTVVFSNPAAPNASPAAGYALVDNGQLVGIVITSPGCYDATDTAISVTLAGGGATVPAVISNIDGSTLTPNVSGGLTKNGAGTLTLSGANTYTGATAVNGGTLNLTGSLTSNVTIANNANLAGEGAITGSLTFAGTSDLGFDPSTGATYLTAASVSGTSGSVTVAPSVPVTGTGIVVLSAAGGISGTAGGSGSNFIYTGRGSLYFNPGNTELLIDTAPLNLVWKGNDGTNPSFWDMNTTTNWDASGAEKFFSNDSVTFDDTASTYLVDINSANVTSGNIVFNNTSTYTLQGTYGITGGGTLTKNGTGTTILLSSNSYTGATTVATGILNIRHANALGSIVAGTTVNSGAVLEIQGGITTAAEALTLNGSGISSGGALRNVSGNNTFGGVVTLASDSTIGVDAGSLSIPSLAGAFGLTKVGGGILNITGASAATPVTVEAGTLYMGAQTGASTTTTLGAATSVTLNGSSNLTVRRTNTGAADLFGAISGSGSLTLLGDNATTSQSGDFTMNNASTYSGGTTVIGARAVPNTGAAFGTGPVTVGANAGVFANAASLTFANDFAIGGLGWTESSGLLGALRLNGTTISGNIALTANSRITGTNSSILSGVISGDYALDFFEDTVIGIITLSGNNTYTGTTTVNSMGASPSTQPNLIVANANALGGTTAGTIVYGSGNSTTGSTLSLANGITVTGETLTLDPVAGSYRASLITNADATATWDGNIVLAGTSGILAFNASGTSSIMTIGGSAADTITGTNSLMVRGTGTGTVKSTMSMAGNLIKTDGSTWAIESNDNSYAGHTQVAGGTLIFGSIANSGVNCAIGAGSSIILGQNSTSAGVLRFAGTSGGSSNRNLTLANGTTGGAGTIDSSVTGQTLTLSGALTVSTPTSACSLTLTGVGDGVFSGGVVGAPLMSLNKTGAGSWTVSGTTNYTGTTSVTAGTLNLDANSVVNSANAVGRFTINGATAIANIAGTYHVANGNGDAYFQIQGGGTLNFSGTSSLTSTTTGAGFRVGEAGVGTLNVTGGSLSYVPTATSNFVVGRTSGGNGTVNITAGTLAVTGLGGFIMANDANTTGTVTVGGTGTLEIATGTFKIGGNASALAATLNLNSGGTLKLGTSPTSVGTGRVVNFDGGTLQASANITLDGLSAANIKDGGAIINSNGHSITINQALLNFAGATTATLTKSGTGTLTLTGANTYTGATSVNAGTLALVGGSQASPITVNSGASLGFTLESGTSSTSDVNFAAGSTVTITGTPTLPSYTLMTTTGAFTGITPVLSSPIPGYQLTVETNNTLKLVQQAGYSSWATVNNAGIALDADHDGDGVSNGVEYFLAGPSGNTTGFTALPGVVNNAGVLSITWPKGTGYAGVYGTDFVVETSATLSGPWTAETIGGGNITDTPNPGGSVKYTFPGGPAYSGKNFARLKVTGP